MRKNRTLTAAITTALSLGSWAVYGAQFENVGSSATDANNAITADGETSLFDNSTVPKRPNVGFDFTGGETVIDTAPTDGIIFASELFGGSLTLPTVISNTAAYMGVIYTIDGDITQNFNMKFTLDNGATFAENPILGVRDKKGVGALVSVTGPSTMTLDATSLSGSTLASGDIFRFSDHSTIYKSKGCTGTNPTLTCTFNQLGTTAGTLTATVTAGTSKVYKSAIASATLGTVRSASVAAVRATSTVSGQKSLAVDNAAAFTAGWSYVCGGASTTANSIFQVQATDGLTSSGNITLLSVTASSSSTALSPYNASNTTGGLLASECSTSGTPIYRIHIPGDTIISLAGNPAAASGKSVQFDVYSTSPGPFLHTTKYSVAAATDAAKNTITVSPGLTTFLISGETLYDTNITVGDDWTFANTTYSKVPMTATAAGSNTATFSLNAGTTTPVTLNLNTNDQVMMLYKLANVGVLATPGQKVNMSVTLKTGGVVDVVVNPERTLTVAQSAQAITASLASIDGGKVSISVSSGSTQFTGSGEGTIGYISSTTAQIGQLTLKDATTSNSANTKMEDGVNPFSFTQGTGATTKVLADNSKLVITGGQFQASKTTPGKVFIQAGTAGASYPADFVTQDTAGDWSATWNLDTAELSGIISNQPGYLRIMADGTNEINTVENQPHGAFTIDFNNAAYKDIITEADLRKISKDGTSCTVYQIPPQKKGVVGADIMSIRITNDSAIAGKIQGTLYDMDGTQLWKGDLSTTELAAGATLRIESDALADLVVAGGGKLWDGRATMKITTILPQVEVMALIRQRDVEFAPLSNLSTGAKGTSCEQN